MGPIVSLVRRHVLLELPDAEWYWQLKGYSARHAVAVERDEAVMESWRAISEGLQLLFPRDHTEAWSWMTSPHPQFRSRPIDLVTEGSFEGLLALRKALDAP